MTTAATKREEAGGGKRLHIKVKKIYNLVELFASKDVSPPKIIANKGGERERDTNSLKLTVHNQFGLEREVFTETGGAAETSFDFFHPPA